MKKKMIVTVVFCIVILGLLSTSTVHAAYNWYTCTVDATGQGDGVVYIALTDSAAAFTQKWFSVSSADVTTANRFLAAAMTAISTGYKVQIYGDPSLGTPLISRLYLMNN